MIFTTTEYHRPVDAEQALEYRFNDKLKQSLSDRIVFENEESNFAPEPSVACRIRNEKGSEFTLIFLQKSSVLMVFGEAGVDRMQVANEFMKELPELQAYIIYRWREQNDSGGLSDNE